MKRQLRPRFWLESGASVASAALFVLTLVWHDWIEVMFGVDPDYHSGSLEWFIAAACLSVTAASFALSLREWRSR